MVQLAEVGVLQRILILRARGPSADGDVLRRLKEQLRPLDFGELRLQSRDNLIGGRVALVTRLQRDEHPAGVRGIARAADRHRDVGDGRILHHDGAQRLLMSHHVLDGNVLRGLRYPGDQTGVLLREKAFRNDDEEINGQGERREEDEQRDKIGISVRRRARAHNLSAAHRSRVR